MREMGKARNIGGNRMKCTFPIIKKQKGTITYYENCGICLNCLRENMISSGAKK